MDVWKIVFCVFEPLNEIGSSSLTTYFVLINNPLTLFCLLLYIFYGKQWKRKMDKN